MQSWFKYAVAFFALVLVLTGFIYVLGPASTRQAFNSGETQTGQILDPNQTIRSTGEGLAETESAGVTADTAQTETTQTTETASGTTEAVKPGTLESTHGTDKSGNAKATAEATTTAPTSGAIKVAPTASPSPAAAPKKK